VLPHCANPPRGASHRHGWASHTLGIDSESSSMPGFTMKFPISARIRLEEEEFCQFFQDYEL